jgi:hypothetical protein
MIASVAALVSFVGFVVTLLDGDRGGYRTRLTIVPTRSEA